jgi:hypothetical protein
MQPTWSVLLRMCLCKYTPLVISSLRLAKLHATSSLCRLCCYGVKLWRIVFPYCTVYDSIKKSKHKCKRRAIFLLKKILERKEWPTILSERDGGCINVWGGGGGDVPERRSGIRPSEKTSERRSGALSQKYPWVKVILKQRKVVRLWQ